jgi:carboxylesterase type B
MSSKIVSLNLVQFNASFPNTQWVPNGGVFHSSEIPIVFGTFADVNATEAQSMAPTAQEYALSNYMRGAWARFAKDPVSGPGWSPVGVGNQYYNGTDDLDLAVLGANGMSGVMVIRRNEVDQRCHLWRPLLSQSL